MPKRECLDCRALIHTGSRCPTCAAAHHGTTTSRGYGTDHQKLRTRYADAIATGLIHCWRCGEVIDPDEPWDLGHDDIVRSKYRGPEHQACNRATRRRR